MRWVLDTNVVASGLLWDGNPRQLKRLARDGVVKLFTSPALLAELTEILSRRKFEKKIAASLFSIDQLVDLCAEFVSLVRPIPVPRIAPDPDDDMVIGTAMAAKANLVVTGDQPFLSVREYRGVRIVSVREALEEAAVAGPPAL
jgi:putative PIN family toxin of toxin-antitoxin system